MAGYEVYIKQNSGQAWVRGFELESGYWMMPHLLLAGNITYTQGRDVSRNEPLRRIPPLHGRMLLQFTQKAFSVQAEWLAARSQKRLAQGDKEDNRIPAGGTPGWQVFNLSATYTHNARASLQLNALNIFNTDYRTHGSGINGVGRSLWMSAHVSF